MTNVNEMLEDAPSFFIVVVSFSVSGSESEALEAESERNYS